MSDNGSPGTAMTSASRPSASLPRSVALIKSAAVVVAARSTANGGRPQIDQGD